MHAVRRLSVPFIQPLARLFNHDELEADRRGSLTPIPQALPLPSTPPPTTAVATTTATAAPSQNLNQTVSNPVTSVYHADADLPLPLQDSLYMYQLSQPSPLKLSSVAFCTADIVWRYKDSERVYNVLQKRGMITPQGEIRTAAITNKFSHQFAFLSAFAQRRVIGLLFWWEEEEQRLKKLYEQEHDIAEALEGVDEHRDRPMYTLLKIELQRTRMLIKQKPSDRHSDSASSIRREQLPAYAPPPRGRSRNQVPPAYTEDSNTYIPG